MIFFNELEQDTPMISLYHYDTKNNKLVPRLTLAFESENGRYIPVLSCPDIITGPGYPKGEAVIVDKNTLETNYYRLVNDFYGGIKLDFHWDSARGMFITPYLPYIKKEIDRCLGLKLTEDTRARLLDLDSIINEDSNDIIFIGKYRQ